jgi:hypothetical protein
VVNPSRLLCLSALLVACPGEPASTTDGASSGGSGESATGTSTGTGEPVTGSTGAAPTTGEPGTTGGTTGEPGTTGTTGEPGTTGTTGEPGTTGAPVDESVTLLDVPCEKAAPAATRCERYEVVCEGLAPAIVDLAIFEAKPGTESKGTVLFGSGGDGTGFYNFTQGEALMDAGFTIVDRRWPAGWFTDGTDGPQQTACRLAAVVRHLRANPPASGPLCATGNSGGSAELGFALTWQNAGPSLDFAMPTSGPFHRLDLACQGEADADWPAECDALRAANCPDCASKACQLGGGPSSLMDLSFGGPARCTTPGPGDLELLHDRSPALGPDVAGLDLPIHMMIGKDDPGAYQPLANALHDALAAAGAAVDIVYVAGAPHEFDSTPAGGEAILDALLTRCAPKP